MQTLRAIRVPSDHASDQQPALFLRVVGRGELRTARHGRGHGHDRGGGRRAPCSTVVASSCLASSTDSSVSVSPESVSVSASVTSGE